MRLWLRALFTFLAITFFGFGLDRLLLKEGIPRFDLLLLSDALVGAAAAALVVVLGVVQQRRSAILARRLQVIAEMNHHTRNALQVITLNARAVHSEPEVQAMESAVERIRWALQEILPKMPDENVSSFPVAVSQEVGSEAKARSVNGRG